MKKKCNLKWIALLGISLLAFTAFLDATIVNTALPFIQSALSASILELQWIANIFTILLSMTMIAIGKCADLWGRKKAFYIGIAFFTIGALGAGCSPNVMQLVIFRAVQAVGASAIFITSAALLSEVFPEKERVKAISIYGGITGLGLMIGPFLGGVLIELLNWRWVFFINLPLIGIGFIACLIGMRGHTHLKPSTKIDFPGIFLLMFGLGTLMYGIVSGAASSWGYSSWAFLLLGIISLGGLIILDETKEAPLLDLRIFKNKLMLLAASSCALAGVASTVFMFFDPLYLRNLRHISPLLIGLLIAVIPAAQGLISLIFSYLIKQLGTRNIFFFSIISALIAIFLHRYIGLSTPLLFLIIPFFLLGVTWGLSNSAMIVAVNEVIGAKKIAGAIGTIATIWNVVGSILLAASAAIFHTVEIKSSFLPAFLVTIDLNVLFAFIILLFASGMCIKLSIKAKKS